MEPTLPSTSRATGIALLVGLAGICYWRVAACGFVWDDDDYVTQNPVLRSWSGLWQIWTEPRSLPQYYPLVHTSFWLEYRCYGLAPAGFHLVNVALHTVAAWSLWRLLQRLHLPGAWFVAAWFLVHPVHVESVAWITERKNVLSMVCGLAAAHRWLGWYDHRRKADQVVGGVWFLLALASKTVIASLPAALCVVWWWRDGQLTRRAVLGMLPWLLVGAALGWGTVQLEAVHVGAADTPWQLHGSERLLVAGRAVWFYLASLLAPFGICFNYPRWQLDPGSLGQWLPVIGVGIALLVAWLLRRRSGRGPLAVLLLFGGILVPALGFFDVFPFRYSFVADHFQYHASVAVLAGVGALGARWLGQAARPVAALVLAGCVLISQGLVANYRDFETLFVSVLRSNPNSALALANLGALANLRGDASLATDYLQRCLALDPYNHEAMVNLGAIAHRAGDRNGARAQYEAALRLEPDDPNASNNLAVLELEGGNAAAALSLAQAAVAADPDSLDARTTRADALRSLQRFAEALADVDHVLQRQTNNHHARSIAVACLLATGRERPAAANALLWLRGRPGDAEAARQCAIAVARVVRSESPATARDSALAICRNGGVDGGPLLLAMADELQRLGANEHAVALRVDR